MQLLREITEASVGVGDGVEMIGAQYKLKKSARAILLNEQGEMATQYLRTYDYHKLPGGGLETGETIEEALLRELKEEVGCDAVVERPLGVTIEYRNNYNLLYMSYGFVARVVGDIGEPQLEPGEIEEGQETLWLPPAEVLQRFGTDQPQKYESHFHLARETAFLEVYVAALE